MMLAFGQQTGSCMCTQPGHPAKITRTATVYARNESLTLYFRPRFLHSFRTPTIDKLASEGVTLMTYYTQPICTPSRTALMTGRYPIRSGMNHGVIGVPAEPWGLPTNESTWAEGMKSLGYRTHIVGKWHGCYFLETRGHCWGSEAIVGSQMV